MHHAILLEGLLAATLPFAGAPAPALPDGSEAPWTLMVYGASDNDSETSFVHDLETIRRHLPASFELVALVDRSDDFSTEEAGFGEDFHDTRLYRASEEGLVRAAGGEQLPGITLDSSHEMNTGSAETLAGFIRWAKATHPARRYALVLYSHGGGYSFCPDEQSGDELYTAELTAALEERDSLDLMVFDVCSMASVENAYEWRPKEGAFGVDVLVATPNAGFPFPWEVILDGLESPEALSALDFGRAVVQGTRRHREAGLAEQGLPERIVEVIQGEAMACLDLARAAEVKAAVDRLAVALFDAEARELAESVRGVGPDSTAMHYVPPGEPGMWIDAPYYDLHDLAARLAARLRSEDSEATDRALEAAEAVAEAVDAMVADSFGMSRYAGFRPGVNGVHITFPNGELRNAYGVSQYANLGWYHPDDRASIGHAWGRYAWCRDGATAGDYEVGNWFELMDAWYDGFEDTNAYRW